MRKKVFNTVIAFLFTFLTLSAFIAIANSATLTLEWDENDPIPDGYAIFQRLDNAVYDYNAPAWEGLEHPVTLTLPLPEPEIPAPTSFQGSFDKASSSITLSWSQLAPEQIQQLYYFVVRAFLGTRGQSDFLESADSEEVQFTAIETNTVSETEIFYSETQGGPYTSLGRVTGQQVTQPLTVVPDGVLKTIYFTIVAFGDGNTYSPNAQEIAIVVDRRTTPDPVSNFRSVTIPVQ